MVTYHGYLICCGGNTSMLQLWAVPVFSHTTSNVRTISSILSSNLGFCSIHSAAPVILNPLILEIHSSPTIDTFESNQKTLVLLPSCLGHLLPCASHSLMTYGTIISNYSTCLLLQVLLSQYGRFISSIVGITLARIVIKRKDNNFCGTGIETNWWYINNNTINRMRWGIKFNIIEMDAYKYRNVADGNW